MVFLAIVFIQNSSFKSFFLYFNGLKDKELGEGMAKSKKAAKHNAAQKALVAIREQKLLTNPKPVDPSVDLNKLRITSDSDHWY